ncbi:hypothetical protein [Arenibaculum pallidiluteum]|nr:hypothetical protein [Arenibaculum pallidiluteum]
MVAELKSFKRDWQRWSSGERTAVRIMALAGAALAGQAFWTLLG